MGGALCSCSDDEWIFRGKVITAAQWTAACPSCLQPVTWQMRTELLIRSGVSVLVQSIVPARNDRA
jgi:hypothetical protein